MLFRFFSQRFPLKRVILNIVCISLVIYSSFLITNWYSGFYGALATPNSNLVYFMLLFIFYSSISHISLNIKEGNEYLMSLQWRSYIINNIIKKINPALINIDNPDQRLCEDSAEFTSLFTTLIFDLILNIAALITFIIILSQVVTLSTAFKLVSGMLLYTLLCNHFFSLYINKILLNLGEKDETNEANLRSYVYQLHQKKYGFDFVLKSKVFTSIKRLASHKYVYSKYRVLISFLQKLTDENVGMIMPYILLFIFFRRNLGDIGLTMKVVHCLTMIKFRMMFFGENLHKIYQCKIGYIRLKKYINHVISNQSTNLKHVESFDDFSFDFQSICVNNKKLLSNIKFGVQPGKSLCLYGQSGIGKTTLLRYLNNSISEASGLVYYKGRARFLCLQNLKDYISLISGCELEFLSQGELQKKCVDCLIIDSPDWIVWDEFCLGLSRNDILEEFTRLKSNLVNTGLIVLSQDKMDLCDNNIELEKFRAT